MKGLNKFKEERRDLAPTPFLIYRQQIRFSLGGEHGWMDEYTDLIESDRQQEKDDAGIQLVTSLDSFYCGGAVSSLFLSQSCKASARPFTHVLQ